MALYRYRCKVCGKEEVLEFSMKENLQALSERKDRRLLCPVCHKLMERVYSNGNFILKSPDFYSKDGFNASNMSDGASKTLNE